MSLHSASSLGDVSSEGAQAHVTNDPTPNSNLPGTRQAEELVNRLSTATQDSELPVQVPPEPIARQEDGREPSQLVTVTEASQRLSQNSASIVNKPASLSNSMEVTTPGIMIDSKLGTQGPLRPIATVHATDGNLGNTDVSDRSVHETEVGTLGHTENVNSLDSDVHCVTEAAVESLELERVPPDRTEEQEDQLLRERLSLVVKAPLETVHVPPDHSESTVPIAPSSPREDLDQQLSESAPSPPTSEAATPAPETPIGQESETLETAIVSDMWSTPPKPSSDGTPTPTEIPTPSNIEEDIKMLTSRLEIGLGTSIEFTAPPEVGRRSLSRQTLPPSTPRPDYFSETPEAVPLHDSHATDASVSGKDVERVSITDGLDASSPLDTPSLESLGETNDHPMNPVDEDGNVETNGLLATPMAAPRHLSARETAASTTGGEPVIVDVRTGAPLLELPDNDEGQADATMNARARMDRLASMLPEPSSSPRSELEFETPEVATPTTAATRLLSAEDGGRSVRSESNRLDFVDDARSERSVGTSIAPIAPNSPRFITPLLTPSLDPDESSLYEGGRTSSILRTSSQLPLTEEPAEESLKSTDGVQELGPELTDALNTSFQHEGDASLQSTVRPQVFVPLASVHEQGASPRARPRHSSSPSTWSIHRASGWFYSPPEKVPGRASMEVAEGEFSRPISRATRSEYPPDPKAAGSSSRRNDTGCVVM